MIKELKELKHCKATYRINYLLIPVSNFPITKKGAKAFNKIYSWLQKQNLYKLERTASGGIKNGCHMAIPAWDLRANKYCAEITLILDGFAWRIQFRTETPKKLSGRTAFTKFKRLLLKDGVDLDKYVIDGKSGIVCENETPEACAAAFRRVLALTEDQHLNMRRETLEVAKVAFNYKTYIDDFREFLEKGKSC